MEKNLNFNRTVVAMAALVIVFAGIKLAAEIVVLILKVKIKLLKMI